MNKIIFMIFSSLLLVSCGSARSDLNVTKVTLRTDFEKERVLKLMDKFGKNKYTFGEKLATGIWFTLLSGGKSGGPSSPLFNTIHIQAVDSSSAKRTEIFSQEITYGKNEYAEFMKPGSYDIILSLNGRFGEFKKTIKNSLVITNDLLCLSFSLNPNNEITFGINDIENIIDFNAENDAQ